MVTEEQALELLSEAAMRLSRGFANRGRIAFVIVQNHDGSVDIIGPNLPADCVDDLFGKAAEGYLARAGELPIQKH
jgi:hypothetical protein